MYHFNEPSLVAALTKLEFNSRIAFAMGAATRQLTTYEYFLGKSIPAGERGPREIATRLWAMLPCGASDTESWSGTLDEVMSMLPQDSDFPLSDDAISSLAYAIRCLLTRDAQEAAWAARRAYEAADQAAIWALDVQTGLPESEAAINAHTFVQRELARQEQDLVLLQTGSIKEVQTRAFQNVILSDDELATLLSIWDAKSGN
jgi:hypothetical protein